MQVPYQTQIVLSDRTKVFESFKSFKLHFESKNGHFDNVIK